MGWFYLACLVFLYIWPSLAVSFGPRKDHPHGAGIIALNLLLGWTFIGWAVAVIWTLTYKPKVNDENGGRG
ncbi:MAG: superinfection immunity protein [Limnohabitans sp.]|nr:superinfection immunity protein [Limnohabitans sp.]